MEVDSCNKDQAEQISKDIASEELTPSVKDAEPLLPESASSSAPLAPIEILGAVKVKDGLFLGDEYASQVISSFS